jgi:outer membrane lipase/esterase
MSSSSLKRLFIAAAATAAAVCSLPALAAYNGLVIFGDSLSDSGNNALALAPNVTPNGDITSNGFVPTFPYAAASPYPFGTYSNGPVWANYFASALGLSATPSLAGGGNFAFGGAVTGAPNPAFPPSLTTQVGAFLTGTGGVAPGSFLYVVAGGGNNARAALEAIAGGADPFATAGAAAFNYATDVGNIVDALQGAGAQHIMVWNTPNIGVAPAVLAQGSAAAGLGSAVAATMNGALAARLAGEAGVISFDLFAETGKVISDPGAYGLSNVSDACLLGACDASSYLFWDGIHPTTRGHQIIAQAAYAAAIPEPQTYALFALGLAALAWRVRRRAG